MDIPLRAASRGDLKPKDGPAPSRVAFAIGRIGRVLAAMLTIGMAVGLPATAQTPPPWPSSVRPVRLGEAWEAAWQVRDGGFAAPRPGRTEADTVVELGAAPWPQVVITPRGRPWDLSAAGALRLEVGNEGAAPVTLLLRLDDGATAEDGAGSMTGRIVLGAGWRATLVLPFPATAAIARGMRAGPPLAVSKASGDTLLPLPKGGVDRRAVTALRLVAAQPGAPVRLAIGVPETLSVAGDAAYAGLVDPLGQYARGTWPEKVTSDTLGAAARAAPPPGSAPPTRGPYGGLAGGPDFAAGGFFRTERKDGRWWLVTPDGRGFFSIGMNAVSPAGGATFVEGREAMFQALPAAGDPLARHYGSGDARNGGSQAQRGRGFDHGRTFDFHAANLERIDGPDYLPAWRRRAAARLRAWGFNTLGNWSEPALWAEAKLPYTVPLSVDGPFDRIATGADWWGPVPDPFDPRFAEAAEAMARAGAAPRRDDPFLLGYFVDNELAWGSGGSTDPKQRWGIVLSVLARGPESHAKRAFVNYLKGRYDAPQKLFAAWGLPPGSWDTLAAPGFALAPETVARPAVADDLALLATRFAEAYYRTVAEALKRHDPNHLYLGSRFAWRTPEALNACARFCDVMSFSHYAPSLAAQDWAPPGTYGKPALIGEFHFGSTDRGPFWPGLVDAGSEEGRAAGYAAYLASVARHPDLVGAHWFQYADQPTTGRLLDGENGHFGFVSVADVPYAGLATAARDANRAVLEGLVAR